MSFADIAFEKVLEQMGNEGKSTYFSSEECESGSYKILPNKYEYLSAHFYDEEEPSDGDSVLDLINKLKSYYKDKYERSFCNTVAEPVPEYFVLHDSFEPNSSKKYYNKQEFDVDLSSLDKALQDYLSTPEKKLCDFVIERVNKMYVKASDMYKHVYMDKRVYSKIVSNIDKNPKFESCVQLAFGLKLDFNEATEMFRLAGNAFSDSIYHRIVKYYIQNGKYEMSSLNECLDKMGIKPIGC